MSGESVSHRDYFLHKLVESGSYLALEQMVSFFVDTLNKMDDGFRTPLMIAASKNNVEIAKLLFDSGASLDIRDNYGWTPLMQASMLGHIDMVRFLLYAGADPNIQDDNGYSALMFATEDEYSHIVMLLLEYKSDFSLVDCKGQSAYDKAEKSGSIIQILRSAKKFAIFEEF